MNFQSTEVPRWSPALDCKWTGQTVFSGELATQLNSSKSKALIADKKLMDIAEAAVKDSPSIQVRQTNGCEAVGPIT